ncbi:DNA/RNA non-specific endonuclease [Noviherbaspirillum sedimenti]|uniref:Endonuclease n=1 Tax=Noviherbaspirillum sedimenti TaxID=2320865 RepID=A0A3A3G0S3_9BURK|nr:DNA/RNA non-specific endonuclease [Noviherbaspirillum sedimenti]RJG01521.1 DNA/RNA non-specific endonuclease [Noviherbaspirillum sedimenti]
MLKSRIILLGLLLVASQAFSRPLDPDCATHFADGTVPELVAEKLRPQTRTLCFENFAVLHSGVSRTPLWSAEYLTAPRLGQARMLKRKNTYHEEKQLPFWQRAELEDYVRSGFDRGHLSPSGDMATDQAQHESFSLANIIPQHRKNNQILWEGIEYSTRELVFERGALYVITGPIFEGEELQRLNGRVLVPTHVFKAIYDPARGEAGAYVAVNAAGLEYQELSIDALEKRIGIKLFPRMRASVKTAGMQLPPPQPYKYRSRGKPMPVAGSNPSMR